VIKDTHDKTRILSRYEKIALDIAYSIAHLEFEEGSLINGRSTLAGKYAVSPETIRRSIKLLEDMSVVESIDKVGIRIKSTTQAQLFIQDYQSKDKILTLRESINTLIIEREKLNHAIIEKVDTIIEQSLTLRNMGIIYPLEYQVGPHSHIVGKRIGEVRFWEYTGATIIGINRGGKLFLSPGPNHIFAENDIIVYVGNIVNISEKISAFIEKED
jgi:K+/H+ antiporter YhaU regulatory subunit KhtT